MKKSEDLLKAAGIAKKQITELISSKIGGMAIAWSQACVQLPLSDEELDYFEKYINADIDNMKISSPAAYKRDGEFIRGRVLRRIKLIREIKKVFLKDKEETIKRSKQGNKIQLVR